MKIKKPISILLRWLLVMGGVSISLMAWTYINVATMKLYRHGTLAHGDQLLAVMVSSSLSERYGVVEVDNGNRQSNVVLDQTEWASLLTLWSRARHTQSEKWTTVDEISESDMANPSTVTISAGPGVRFAILDDGVCTRFTLEPQQFAYLDRSLRSAQKHLITGLAPDSVFPSSTDPKSRIDATTEAFRAMVPKSGLPITSCR